MKKVRKLLKQKGSEVYSINYRDTLLEVVDEMTKRNIGALVVIDGNKNIKGIISERDILRKLYNANCNVENVKLKEVMTESKDLIVATMDDSLEYVMNTMTDNRVRHIPVVDKNGKLKGIVSIGDIVKAQLSESNSEIKMLKDYIQGSYPV